MQYSEKTLQYYNNLQNIGDFLDDDLDNVGTGIVGSPLCGDVMKLQIVFDNNGKIIDATYKVFGCVSAIASMEFVTRMLKGISIEEALKINNNEVADSLELSNIKRHCSVLAKEVIETAINNYMSKKNKEHNMITVTEAALIKLKELVKEQGCLGIGISVTEGGCSGFEYSLSYETEISEHSANYQIDGLNFYYDKNIELLINGTVIDIIENSFGHGFVITNKTHRGCKNCTCGCYSD